MIENCATQNMLSWQISRYLSEMHSRRRMVSDVMISRHDDEKVHRLASLVPRLYVAVIDMRVLNIDRCTFEYGGPVDMHTRDTCIL